MVISKKDRMALVNTFLLLVFAVTEKGLIFVVLFFILIYWGVRANELDKLAKLKQKGVISDDEFLSFKRKLLD